MSYAVVPSSPELLDLIELVEQAVQSRKGGRIRGLRVSVHRRGVCLVISGRTSTYYNKQLATHAVRDAVDDMAAGPERCRSLLTVASIVPCTAGNVRAFFSSRSKFGTDSEVDAAIRVRFCRTNHKTLEGFCRITLAGFCLHSVRGQDGPQRIRVIVKSNAIWSGLRRLIRLRPLRNDRPSSLI